MDRIVWDTETMQSIVFLLRNAVQTMEDCSEMLHIAHRDGSELFCGSDKSYSQRILNATYGSMQRTRLAAERANGLAEAMIRILDRIQAAEAAVLRLAEEVPTGGNAARPGADPSFVCHTPGFVPIPNLPNRILVLRQQPALGGFTPNWLSDAADQTFWP